MLRVPVNISRTHSLTTGYNASFYQDYTTFSVPQQEATAHPSVSTYSPVSALLRGSEYPPVARQASTTRPLRPAPPIRPRRYAAAINPGQHPYARPQAVPNSGSSGFDFTSAGEFSLPTAYPSSSRTQSYGGCKPTPLRYLIRTTHHL